MNIMEIGLPIFDPRKGIADLAFSRPQRFHFRALQDKSRLESFENVVIVAGFRVGQNVSHRVKPGSAGRGQGALAPLPVRPAFD